MIPALRSGGIIEAGLLLGVSLLAGCGAPATTAQATPSPGAPLQVTARGRIEPRDGVLTLSGPSDFVAVVGRLEVREGERVRAGQVVAVMDTLAAREASLSRAEADRAVAEAAVASRQADLANAVREDERHRKLADDGIVSAADRDSRASRRAVAEADLQEAHARFGAARAAVVSARVLRDMAIVRAPCDGQVLEIHARAGEKIEGGGILELARNDSMYAVAQVYESDVARVRVGQRAHVRGAGLPGELTGVVERIGLKVGRLDALGTDPVASTDARVVEVRVRLDDPRRAAHLTHLEVFVVFEP